MIQILAIREFYSQKNRKNVKAEVWFDKGMRAASVEELFSRGSAHFLKDKVEPSERYNLYYTVADCLEEKGRKLLAQHHIPFDVDKLDVPENPDGTVNYDQLIVTAKVVCRALNVEFNSTGVVFSGNGLQFIVGTTKSIDDVAYFDQVRSHYKAVCDRINLALKAAGLAGEADPSVWSPARLMRLPDTLNVKPNRPERMSRLLQPNITRIDYDLEVESRLPKVEAQGQIADSVVKNFPTPDVKTILDSKDGCRFLAWAQTNPEEVSEPEWYAAVSVTARFPEGRKFTHQMSKGHPGYSYAETETKIDQALSASGPRTCKNIHAISGGKCEKFSCKHWGTNLVSPLLIEGPEHVKTANTGFHNVYVTKEGVTKIGKPDYEGLCKHFMKETTHVTNEGGQIYVFNGTHYTRMEPVHLRKYAYEKFFPKVEKRVQIEFVDTLKLYNIVSPDWFTKSVEGKMNFQNGVLDVKSGILTPHSADYGFQSVLSCNYAPEATAPRFEKFIEEVTMGREDLACVLQEFMGYVFGNLDPDKYQKMLLLIGGGENGKSKFVELIRHLVGQGNASNLSIALLSDAQNRVMLDGKLVNISEENPKHALRYPSLVKDLVSGGIVQAKRVFEAPYQFANRAKLIMLANETPETNDNTHGFYRRFLIVPFDQTFSDEKGNKDIHIMDKLLAELPGIFNWAIEGMRRLEKNARFTMSETSHRLLENYKIDTDSIHSWMNDHLEYDPDPTNFVDRQSLYDDYRRYCEMTGIRQVESRRKVIPALKQWALKHGAKDVDSEKRIANKEGKRVEHINHMRLKALSDF